jgi:hypothetical protein
MKEARLKFTWSLSWGLLIGFITGVASVGIFGIIRWSYVGIAFLGAWLLSSMVAWLLNENANKTQ